VARLPQEPGRRVRLHKDHGHSVLQRQNNKELGQRLDRIAKKARSLRDLLQDARG